MEAIIPVLALGLLLGVRHAFDPDHVVAVTTIVSRQRSVRAAAVVGALWGLGHSATIFVVGGALILFKVAIPPRLGLALEMAVAVMLVLLGLRNLHSGADRPAPARRPVAVGLVHGLAGSGAVALLVLTAITDARWALAYLLVFGLGTTTGMMAMTATIATPTVYGVRRFEHAGRWVGVAAGLASIAFGALLAYRIGVVDGLFSSAPTWTPR
jgi:high-affinity nickel-transport protein